MTIDVNVTRDEVSGWREFLLILALDRWQPLWTDLGLSASIAAAPGAVQGAAARCWQIKLALHDVRSQGADDHRAMIEEMVRDFFAQVVRDYGEEESIALHRWARRQYVDSRLRNAYLVWSQILRRLAGIAGLGAPLVALSLSPDAVAAITGVVVTHLALDLQRADAARIHAVAHAAASTLEALVAAREADLMESLRESLPEGLTNERAHRALVAIVPGLDLTARNVFIAWAHQQAVAMEMPPQLDVDLGL